MSGYGGELLAEYLVPIVSGTEPTDTGGRLSADRARRLDDELRDLEVARRWIVLACREHHDDVTSPTGERRELAMDMGWLLLENETAAEVPVAMDGGSYYLDDAGGKTAVDSQTPPGES